MASLNTVARELVLKIVYYGPGLGGKTSSLQALHDASPPERRGKLVSLATPVDRTLYFDFLPLRLPPLRGLAVRLQLFTVPGQVYFNATRRLVLSGADGVVFVADAQPDRLDANLESLENLRENLAEHGRDLASLPHAFAFNKRDLPDVLSNEELDKALNLHRAPWFGTVATRGEGVQQTLDEMTRLVLQAYEAQLPEPAASERAVHVDDAPPSVRVSQSMPAVREIEQAHDDPEIVTSVAELSPGDDDPVVTSSLGNGTFLADVSRIEKRASQPRVEEEEPESVVGTAWDKAPEESRGLSFAPLFAPGERALIEQIEQAIAHGDHGDAVGMCDAAISRILASVASIVASEGRTSPSDPALPLLLGLDGRRFLAFRALARRARQIGDVGIRDALESFAFVLEARVAAGQWESVRTAVGATSQPPPSRQTAPPPSALPPLPRGTLSPPPSDS
jgi:signal recognition particle receptor subunit beta